MTLVSKSYFLFNHAEMPFINPNMLIM